MHAVSVGDRLMQNHNENTLRMDVIHSDLNTAYVQMGNEVLFLTCNIKVLEITISGPSVLSIEFVSALVI